MRLFKIQYSILKLGKMMTTKFLATWMELVDECAIGSFAKEKLKFGFGNC